MRILLIAITIFIGSAMLFSCKKETITNTKVIYDTLGAPAAKSSPYYIKATVDGKDIMYTNTFTFPSYINSNRSTYNLDAYDTTTGSTDYIIILVANTESPYVPLTTGVYTDTANIIASMGFYNPNLAYMDLIQYNKDFSNRPYVDSAAGAGAFTCTITTINDSVIRGTFSGKQYIFDSVKTVTNGSFYESLK